MQVEGIPDGWELVRVGRVKQGEFRLGNQGQPLEWTDSLDSGSVNYVIVREKPKRFRHFANAAEYAAKRHDRFFVDWKDNEIAPGFHAVVSTNELYCWVALGDIIKRFAWWYAFEKLEFRHADGSTSPFGVEVTE